jgi:hypothetical protein
MGRGIIAANMPEFCRDLVEQAGVLLLPPSIYRSEPARCLWTGSGSAWAAATRNRPWPPSAVRGRTARRVMHPPASVMRRPATLTVRLIGESERLPGTI